MLRQMNSSRATALSTTSITCVSPEWGLEFVEANTTLHLVEVYPSTGVEKFVREWRFGNQKGYQPLPADFPPVTGFVNSYRMYQILLRITAFPNSWQRNTEYADLPQRSNAEVTSPNGGRAKGWETVTVEARGLHLNSNGYAGQFDRNHDMTLSRDAEQSVESLGGFETTSVSELNFTTPPWGAQWPYGTTLLSLRYAGLMIASQPDDQTLLHYYWYQEWENISKVAGNSMGGTLINITGFGLSGTSSYPGPTNAASGAISGLPSSTMASGLTYTCRFQAGPELYPTNVDRYGVYAGFYDAHVTGTQLVSSEVMQPAEGLWGPTVILCRTPNWGKLYPSMSTRVSVFEGDAELEYRGGDEVRFENKA
jgi:hypothetical protein